MRKADYNGTRQKARSGVDLRGASPLVSFNHVIDPHFVAFSRSLYITICIPKPNSNRNPNLNSDPDPDPNPDPNPTVIIDPQIGPRVEIRKLSPFRSAPLRILSCVDCNAGNKNKK